MTDSIVIERRFRGPQASGNGGYSAGLVARPLRQPAEVTLRKPPPLDRPIRLVTHDGRAEAYDGDMLVAEGVAIDSVDLEPPRTVTYDEAEGAAASYAGLSEHLFPECFTCGPARVDGDGLRVFSGPLGPGLVAAPWTPHPSVAGDDGVVPLPVVWAALDCPSAWAGDIGPGRPAVLGRLAVEQRQQVRAGEPLVVLGWLIEDLPRKYLAGSALMSTSGEVVAVGRATWVQIDPAAWSAG